jgi:hypothetical protein
LFDCVREQFGDESVFMDVTDIHPGDDFVTSLDSALSSSRIVLAVIGPDWLTCTGADGRRRLDDPGDHLRLEVAHALRANARVIPVLVRAARMPDEHELPDDLKPLARRQAQEVSDSRWSYDTDQLVRIIESTLGRHAPKAAPYTLADARDGQQTVQGSRTVPRTARLGSLRVVATAAVFVVLMALALYSKWSGGSTPAGPADSGSSSDSAAAERARNPAGAADRRPSSTPAARLPPSGEARAGAVVFTVLGGFVSRDSDGPHTLRLLMRVTNIGAPSGFNISGESFRLVIDGDPIAPEESLIEVASMQSAVDGYVTFNVPASAGTVALQVGDIRHEYTSKIPLDLRTAGQAVADKPAFTWRTPADLPVTFEKQAGPLLFKIDGLRLEHLADAVPPLQPEKLELTIKMRLFNVAAESGYAAGGDEYRLIVDDVPLAPTAFPINVVNYQATLPSEVKFTMPGTAANVVLQLGHVTAGHVAVPLDLSAARR